MSNDHILLDLIEESVLAPLPARRRAAKALLELLQARKDLGGLAESIRALDLARDVREQAGTLIARINPTEETLLRT